MSEETSVTEIQTPAGNVTETKPAEKEPAPSEAEGRLAVMAKTVAGLEARLAKAAASYRALIVSAHPEIPEDLISGGDAGEIDASLAKASGLVTRVKQGLAAAAARSRVPPGAPPRTELDPAGMSPREKIKYGIGGK